MLDAMEALFYEWMEAEIKASPEYEKLLEDKDFDEYCTISGAVVEEQKIAFKAGFRIAVQLITGNN